jgi:hypothetical protein
MLRRGIQKGAHFANLCNCDYIVCTMSTNQDTLDCQAHMKVYKGVTPL